MPNLGFPELVLILVLALIIFGPRKLPEVGKALGKTLNEFRKASSSAFEEAKEVMGEDTEKPEKASEEKL